MLVPRDRLSDSLKCSEVEKHYYGLKRKKVSLGLKRVFDVLFSSILLILTSPVLLVLAGVIKKDSKGPVFYLQSRVTKNNENFKIFKFRTMVQNADILGSQVTVSNDPRVTQVGHFLRKYRLDELPQLINILKGEMTFVGTRPEVRRYVDRYSPEMRATLLLPAGVTSLASIAYKDEQDLLDNSQNVDETYINIILPEKMKYNIAYLENFSLIEDLKILLKTIKEVLL